MRGGTVLGVALVLTACGSSEPRPQSQPQPAPSAPAAQPAPRPADPDADPSEGGIVIKGSKHHDDATATAADDDPATRNSARIEELKRRAAGGGSTGDWQEFADKDGGYHVLFPAPPTAKLVTTKGPTGASVEVHMFTYAKPDGKRAYTAAWRLLSQAERDSLKTSKDADVATLIVAALGAVAVRGKLIETRAVETDGYPGRESKIDDGQLCVRSRVFIVGNRVLQAVAAAPPGEIESRDIFKFLESLRIPH
jgi:hypothetical protein